VTDVGDQCWWAARAKRAQLCGQHATRRL
jgi:hypothetical protein